MIFNFGSAIKFEGKDYASVELNVEDMSGKQIAGYLKNYSKLAARNDAFARSITTAQLSDDFVIYVASQVSGQPIEFFETLSVADYIGVIGTLQGFFNGSVSPRQEA